MSASQFSVLAKDLVLTGQLEGAGNIKIHGVVKGKILLNGDCHVDHGGQIDGDIEAMNINLAGKVTGNLAALNRVEILGTGQVHGDIRVPRISISDGASINGHVHVGDV